MRLPFLKRIDRRLRGDWSDLGLIRVHLANSRAALAAFNASREPEGLPASITTRADRTACGWCDGRGYNQCPHCRGTGKGERE
jgi:hypothetical protein